MLIVGMGTRFMLVGLAGGVLAGDILGVGQAPAYAGWGFFIGAARALLMGVWVGPDGLRIRNPWRTYTVAWSNVLKVVDFWPPQPEIGFGGKVPALILADGSKKIPLCPLLAVGPWTGRLGSYNRYLRRTVRSWQDEFGVQVLALNKTW